MGLFTMDNGKTMLEMGGAFTKIRPQATGTRDSGSKTENQDSVSKIH